MYYILYSRSDGCFTDELAVETLPVKLETWVRIQQIVVFARAGFFLEKKMDYIWLSLVDHPVYQRFTVWLLLSGNCKQKKQKSSFTTFGQIITAGN